MQDTTEHAFEPASERRLAAGEPPDERRRRRLRPRASLGRSAARAVPRSTQAELAWLKAEVQRLRANAGARADLARRDLIANVSHDLRTPLVSLRGYLDMLVTKGDALDSALRAQYLAVALRQSESLARLIDELFDLARLDFDGAECHCEPFAPMEFVADVMQKFQLQAQGQGVGLRLDAAPDLPFARGDLGLVERALDNLIGNALKHTPRGGCVHVALRVRNGRLDLEVGDTGCGIPADELPFVFDRYYRGSSRTRTVCGAGLGLAIARRIAEMHGGELTVTSRHGEGTRFAFALPLVPAVLPG